MNSKIKTLAASAAATATSLAVLAQPAYAQWPWQTQSLEGLAGLIIRYIMGLGALIAIGVLVWGGISYMTSGGDKMKVQQSQATMTSAIVGLLVVFGAYLIIQTICRVTGLEGSVWCAV